MSVVRAAGVLPWRLHRGQLRVALVHRPRYDDWSWAKGKLDRGEEWAAAAARETLEETGVQVRLGLPLPGSEYQVDGKSSPPVLKQVRYWAGSPVGGTGVLEHEVDEVAWLSPTKARARLSYPRDHDQLEALVAAHDKAALDVWPMLLVRHAKAVPRGAWDRPDPLRPLDGTGTRRATRLVPVLTAYAPAYLVSSPSTRCVDTLLPYARTVRSPVDRKVSLSEEGYTARPHRVHRHLAQVLQRAEAVALCTHGPVLPGVLKSMAARAATRTVATTLRRLAGSNLDKGEVLACTMLGSGPDATVLAVERHRPPRS